MYTQPGKSSYSNALAKTEQAVAFGQLITPTCRGRWPPMAAPARERGTGSPVAALVAQRSRALTLVSARLSSHRSTREEIVQLKTHSNLPLFRV